MAVGRRRCSAWCSPIVALALAVGAAYPNLDADNAAKVAASAGGLVYMVLCMSFIGAVVVLEAWPVYAIFSSRFTRRAARRRRRRSSIVASFAGGRGCSSCSCSSCSVRQGIRRLEAIEP